MTARILSRTHWASQTFTGWYCTVEADSADAAEQAVADLGLIGDTAELPDGRFDILVIGEAAP